MRAPIQFQGVFGYREYLQFLTVIRSRSAPAVVEVDLEHVSFAHPNGMVPLVAAIQNLHIEGWRFDVCLPNNGFLAGYFEKAGWVAGIAGDPPPPLQHGRTYIPLSSYRSHDELNPLVNEIIKHIASTTALAGGVLDAIGWSLNEIADNVLLHAGENVCGWIQMIEQPKKHRIEFVVVDCGRGIPDSLRTSYPELGDDRELVMKAVEKGVTRDPDIGQGNGLAGTIRIANAANGWANVHSGTGQLRTMPDQQFCQVAPFHQGTLVEVTLPTDKPIDVAEALWGFEPMNELEMDYLEEGGSGVLVRLRDETSGFGNRASAKPVRVKLLNLMTQFPGDMLTLDFDGATLISASFADELIARLVREVGPTTFFARVRLINLSDLARRTIDAVIAQRLAAGM